MVMNLSSLIRLTSLIRLVRVPFLSTVNLVLYYRSSSGRYQLVALPTSFQKRYASIDFPPTLAA